MNDLKEQAKKILAKGKELNDPDLIGMALEMLDAYEPEIESKTKPSKARKTTKAKSERVKATGDIADQFRMNNSGSSGKLGRKAQLSREPRVNKFEDDGLEFTNLKGKTPPAQPKTKRKVNKKNVTCRVCGKKEKILTSLIMPESDSYRCDSCILKGRFG